MNRIRVIIIFSIISAFGVSGIFLSSCSKKTSEGLIVFTLVPGKLQNADLAGLEASRQGIQSKIAAFDPGKPGSQPVFLTEGFYSAKSPRISYDGARMLFSGQQKKNDIWQIWEMDLGNSKFRQITSLPENCFGPAYLPNDRVVFTREASKETQNSELAIVSCNADGSEITRSTFNPCKYSFVTVLKDGRLLAISEQKDPSGSDAEFMVLRPDGTKNELFYESPDGISPCSRGWETPAGNIVFTGSGKGGEDRGQLVSISYNRPLNSFVNLSSETEGSFISVYPVRPGKLIVAYRKSESDNYGLYEFDQENKTLGSEIYSNKEYDIAEVVAAEKQERPKKLPSEVDMGVKTGLILCQDVNFHDMNTSTSSKPERVNRIRIIGRDSTLGEISAERDGSFFLKVIADTPFRIQTIDDNGNAVGRPCGWIYLRPNERRGCIGCHEDHEMVPENKVSLAVRQAPVSVPVHISKMIEKKVSLE
jgi:hypothetical protein